MIVDAVGVTRSVKTASQPLDTKPTVPLKDLAMALMMGQRDAEIVSSLAGRLARLDRQLDQDDRDKIETEAGQPLQQIVSSLLSAIDPDNVTEAAKQQAGAEEPSQEALDAAQDELVNQASNVFTGPLINLIDSTLRMSPPDPATSGPAVAAS